MEESEEGMILALWLLIAHFDQPPEPYPMEPPLGYQFYWPAFPAAEWDLIWV